MYSLDCSPLIIISSDTTLKQPSKKATPNNSAVWQMWSIGARITQTLFAIIQDKTRNKSMVTHQISQPQIQ